MEQLHALKSRHTPAPDRAAVQRTSQELFNLIAIVGIAAPAAIPWACAIIVLIGSLLAAGLRLGPGGNYRRERGGEKNGHDYQIDAVTPSQPRMQQV